jgi:putative ABC transport system permease protein
VSVLGLLHLISIPQLRASWVRTVLVVVGTLIGVALIVGINVINTSAVANVRRSIALIAGPADLQVTLGVGEIGFPESTVESVRKDPGVRVAVPLLHGTVSLADDPAETLQLFGADLTAEEDLQRYTITTVTNRREVTRTLEDPTSILLTEAFAAQQNLGVGATVQVSTPKGIQAFTVRGLLRPEGLAAAFGGRLAVMDLTAAQRWLGKDGRIDQIDIVLQDDTHLDEVARRLQATLPDTLTVGRPVQRSLQYERVLASFQAMLTGLSLLCLIAGVFIIYNTTSTGALNRALVMASLRRIGATPSQLFQLLMLEALILGTIGTLLGIGVGVLLARLLVGMVTQSMGVIFQLRFSPEAQTIDPHQLALVALVGIAATLFASCFAARRVASMDPLAVSRAHARRPAARSTRALVAWWMVLVAISAAALMCEQQFKSIAWGNFGATLWNASVIVIAIPLVSWLAPVLSNVLSRVFGAEGEVAATSLFRSPTRTGVTVAAVALVLTVGIMVSSLELSFHRTTETYVEGFLRGDLIVSAVVTEGGWLETPLPEEVADEIAKIQGVRTVETVRALPGQLYRGERIGIGAGSDGLLDPARLPPQWYREGDPAQAAEAVRAGRAANVSTALADRFDLHVGDVIEFDTPTGKLALPIAGVVPDLISDRGSALISRRLLIERWHESTVSRILVSLEPGESLEAVRARIAERFGHRYLLKVLSMRDVLAYHHDKVNSAFAFTDAIQLLIIVVTVAGIFDLLLSAIVERRRELAVWRLIGADDRAVHRSVVIESATVGVIGAVLGVAAGVVTAWIWIAVNFRYLLGYHLEHHLAFGATVWYVTLVILMTMLAGYAAARQATRHSILSDIRTD